MTEDRRDSAMFRAAFFKYDARRLDRVRKAIASFQHFQVLSGATMSRAALLHAAAAVLVLPRLTIWHGPAACAARAAPRGRVMWLRPGSAGLRVMPRMMRSSRGSSRSARGSWMRDTHECH